MQRHAIPTPPKKRASFSTMTTVTKVAPAPGQSEAEDARPDRALALVETAAEDGCSKGSGVASETPPTAVYLRHLVRSLVLDEDTPIAVRNECDRLILAINANSFTLIAESLTRIDQIAEIECFQLPRVTTEPTRRD